MARPCVDAIILAAGKGRRMAPLCTRVPKPMLPLAGRPILQHVLERVHEAGVRRAVLVVEHLATVIEQSLQVPAGMEVVFARQGEPKGTGHAVHVGAQHVDGDALVLMGDSLVDAATIQQLAAAEGFVVAASRVDEPRAYGVLDVEGDLIRALVEKPADPPSDLANTGMYRVPAQALADTASLKPSPRGELEFTDLVQGARWIEARGWLDIGNPWQYLQAHETLFPHRFAALPQGASHGDGTVEPGVQVRGRLIAQAGATIKSGTYIEGDVLVRQGAVVGPNAYLRGPVEVGPGCKLGAASEVKNSILLAGAQAPHHNYVGDSVLGHGCNLGSGTKIANLKHTGSTVKVDWDGTRMDTGRRKFGAVVGDGAKTGINASLNPGTVLAAGATVGAGQAVGGWVTSRRP